MVSLERIFSIMIEKNFKIYITGCKGMVGLLVIKHLTATYDWVMKKGRGMYSADEWLDHLTSTRKVNFKVFGILPLTFLFTLFQFPILKKYQIED